MEIFSSKKLKQLFSPENTSNGEDNGQVTIIGGSSLFKGAPLFALKTASRVVDMVFFSSPEPTMKEVVAYINADVPDFVWVPFEEISKYIEKSDAVLIGPGFMRFKSELTPHNARTHICDEACELTRNITKELLTKFPHKKWVIDAGSLQTIDAEWIPENAIVTPNRKEFKMLFKIDPPEAKKNVTEEDVEIVQRMAEKYKCIVVLKGPETIVASSAQSVVVKGGNPGLTKGGTGDTQSGITVALLAKNEPFLAACSAAYLIKKAADEIHERVGVYYNATDVGEEIPRVLASLTH